MQASQCPLQQREKPFPKHKSTLSRCSLVCLCLYFLIFMLNLCCAEICVCWYVYVGAHRQFLGPFISLVFTRELLWECSRHASFFSVSHHVLFLHGMLGFVVLFVTPQPQSSLDNEGEQYLWQEGHNSVWNTHA